MKYLMRGGMSPLDNFSVEKILADDSFGGNSGNLLYLFSVFKTLMIEDTKIDVDYYRTENQEYSDEEMEYINTEYDAYICPLADAFRPDFRKKLLRFENFFRSLRIPVVVIGIGLRASYEPHLEERYIFDEEAKRFMSAVLEKTECIGVRGNITADYLTKLGYKIDRDFKVIGCPSMYTWGQKLPDISIGKAKINEIKLAINAAPILSRDSVQFLEREVKNRQNYCYVGQEIGELRSFYLGHPYKTNAENGMNDIMRLSMKEEKFEFFVGVNEWFDFMKACDLSIGGRLHGNVAALLAGCPAIFLPSDARMRELAEFHHFSQVPATDNIQLKSLEDILEQVDLSSHLTVQSRNFLNYVEFLEKNHIKHIYENKRRAEVGLQKKIKIDSIRNCDTDEIIKREMDYYALKLEQKDQLINQQKKLGMEKIEKLQKKMEKEEKRAEAQIKNEEEKNAELQREIDNYKKRNIELERIINSRAVRLALKLRGILRNVKKIRRNLVSKLDKGKTQR